MTTRTKQKSPAAAAKATAGNNGFSLISNQKLLQLYTAMVRCRMIEERARAVFKQSKSTGNYGAAVGQEAAAVGVAIDLGPDDAISPAHRDFIVDFIKGVPLDSTFCRLFARAASPAPSGYAPLNVIPPSSNLAARLDIAAGVALANKMQNNGKIAVAFSGDGSASLESWREALHFAGVHQLPILFVCQNNVPVEPLHRKTQARGEEIALHAQACGIPAMPVDGNDVVAVYRVATEAIAQARKGNGPTLIECKTCGRQGHSATGPGNAHDPILNMEKYLTRKGLFSIELKLEVAAAFSRELDAAIAAAGKSPLAEGKD